ncbi:hypothetical protein MBOU_55410 [Mycobacterium bourgelatii]|uniref:Uncharacterized protein n=1 Tax=Mycobacterium bourgelatii TaxID=1273442 RepID=A0A7I9YXP0_MYCBU|nr:hypothetical protein MBOU_55410 [Mycobacterium bourgelatii]
MDWLCQKTPTPGHSKHCWLPAAAIKARTAAIQQIKDLLVTAPAELRERYRRYRTTLRLVEALARCHPPRTRIRPRCRY